MKIKDIVREGLASSFGKALLPSQLQTTLQTLKTNKRPLGAKERTELEPQEVELAKAAHAKFGDNPESVYPGFVGWLPPQQLKSLVDYKAKLAKQKEREQEQKQQRQRDQIKQEKGKKRLARDIFGTSTQTATAQPASTRPVAAQPAPPQVRLPSGQYITKYGSSWYDETGERIVIPGDIERLERMAQGPSGQSQMAATKNIPVDLPGYKGKKK